MYGFDEFTRHFSGIKDGIEKEESQGGEERKYDWGSEREKYLKNKI